jgi:TonB-linked SusC/RagA family outer membrane protein
MPIVLGGDVRKFGLWVLTLLLTLCVSAEASAQRRVTGRITGPSGEPVVAASVNVQGTTIGGYTTEEGRFTLANVPAGAQVIVVRRLGFRRTAQPLAATSDNVDIRLERDVLQLETQVVTGTTTSISSANAANSVAQVSAEQLSRTPTPTVENALQGKIAGAVISTNSGAPGGGAQIQLRGVTSINANSSPLYVIDGVLVSNAEVSTGLNSISNAGTRGVTVSTQDQPTNRISDISPGDIETIEVLKGASAGAIYGSKGANGVIVITTKRGTTGRPAVSFAQRLGRYSLSNKLGLRCFGSAAEVADWSTNTVGNDATDTAREVARWTGASNKCHDFEQEFYGGNDMSYETALSVRGGNEATTYYVGGLAKRDNAIQPGTYYQKQSLTANVGQLIGTRLNLRANNEFIHSLTDRGISGNDNDDIVSPGDIFSTTPSYFDLKTQSNGLYPVNPYLSSGSNPFQNAELVKNPEDVFRYIGSVNATWSAYASQRQTLDFTFIGGIDAFSLSSKLTSSPSAYFEPNDGNAGTITTNKTTSANANLNLSGAHKFIHDMGTATTSFGLRQERRQRDAIYNTGKSIPNSVSNVNFGVNQYVNEVQFLVKDFAYYAQEELLALDERLLLTAAINAERSSVNGDDKKFYAYPKAAVSYRVPALPSAISDLKLRLAFGKAGNQPNYGVKFTTLPYGTIAGLPGARISAILGSPDIRPETTTELEGGFDATAFNGRVATDVTMFRKTVDDLILEANVAPSTGYQTRLANAGQLRNTGVEIGLNVTPIQTNEFSWLSRTTFARVRGTITRLDVAPFNGGAGFGVRYGLPYIEQGGSVTAVQVVNGCKVVTASCTADNRLTQIFESAPDFTMGFSNELTYGPVRLYGLLDWRKGGYGVNLTQNYFDGSGTAPDTAAMNARNAAFAAGTDVYLQPAGFVKIREISLGYALPRSLVQNAFMGRASDIRLEVSGRNLKTWTKYQGYDPEVSNFGSQNIGRFIDVTPYPPSRSIFVSLSANF